MEVIAFGFSLISVILTVIKVLNNSNFQIFMWNAPFKACIYLCWWEERSLSLRDLQRTIKSPSRSKQDNGKSKLQRIKKNSSLFLPWWTTACKKYWTKSMPSSSLKKTVYSPLRSLSTISLSIHKQATFWMFGFDSTKDVKTTLTGYLWRSFMELRRITPSAIIL